MSVRTRDAPYLLRFGYHQLAVCSGEDGAPVELPLVRFHLPFPGFSHLSLGNVRDHADGHGNPALLVKDRGNVGKYKDCPAVLADVLPFRILDDFAGEDSCQDFAHRLQALRPAECVPYPPAYYLVGGKTVDLFKRGIDLEDCPVAIVGDNRDRRIIEYGSVVFGRDSGNILSPGPLPANLRFSQFPNHRGHQARESALQ